MYVMEKKRKDLSLKEKCAVLEKYDMLPKMSQRNAAAQLKISQPLLCKILKNRNVIMEAASQNENLNCRRNRGGKDEKVESALKLWFSNVREQDARVNGPLMRQKAEELAKKMGKDEFIATEGWFHRWKKRANIVYKRTHGEIKDADFGAADNWIKDEWPKIISEFSPENVYNADETGLYYRALPEHTYIFKNEGAQGCKISKERLTVLCCVNMIGNKEKLLVISKYKNPRCFRNVSTLPVNYHSNSNAWMTTVIFNEWLIKWDAKLNRKIVLLVDNCTAHSVNSSLKNIKVVFLPANTTSILQPCDQGIIRTLKAYYRREMRSRILENMEDTNKQQMLKVSANDLAKKTSLLDALHLLAMSWNHVSENTIQNCFKHGGFSTEPVEEEILNIQQLKPSDMTENEFEEWITIDQNVEVAAQLTDHDICEMVTTSESIRGEIEENECEEYPPMEKPPSNAQMRQALDVLRRGVQARSVEFEKHYNYEDFINNLLRNNERQSTLKEFF